MQITFFIAVALLQVVLSTSFSIGFHAGSDRGSEVTLVNVGSTFTRAPTAEHVADVYSRLSGLAPLLWEEKVNLPAAENVRSRPVIVQVAGGVLPSSVTNVISTSDPQAIAPNLEEVVAYLKNRGVECESKKLEASEVQNFFQSQSAPAVVLHHETESRRLDTDTSSNSTVPISEFEIAQYQICLWTAVVFVVLGLGSICAMVNMDVVPDNLLYAKFQSGRTDKRD